MTVMATEALKLTAQIVISHASMSELTPKELVDEIKEIYNVLSAIEGSEALLEATGEVVAPETAAAVVKKPSIPLDEIVKEKYVVCLECGKKMRTLKAHLRKTHQLAPAEYFRRFNLALRTTDVLWTKPSELSFYTALGLPIVMAPPLGSQERANREWLERLGAGVPQSDPRYADEWLFDLVESGWLAEAAMQGFVEGEQLGSAAIRATVGSARGRA
jgi:predicted transcriptional regulator